MNTKLAPTLPSVAEQIVDDVVGLLAELLGIHFHGLDPDASEQCPDCEAVFDELNFDTLSLLLQILEEAEENHEQAEVPA